MAEFDEILSEELDRYERDTHKPELSLEALRVPLSAIGAAKVETLPLGASVEQAVRIIQQPGTSCVAITDHAQRLVGLITERDLCTRIVSKGIDPRSARVEEIMTKDPLALRSDHPLTFALAQLDVGGYRHIPLVDRDHHPVGVVTARRVINYLVEFFPDEVKGLPPRPLTSAEQHGG